MGCFYPLAATQLPGGEIIVHKRTPGIPAPVTPPGFGRDIKLPCGRCIGCRIKTQKDWATRCLHESQLHKANSFLTLTIDSAYGLQTEDSVCAHQDMCTAEKSASVLSTIAKDGLRGPNNAHVGNTLAREDIGEELRGSLNKKTHQKFIKRLREKIDVPVRFYMCGEYGAKLRRPHYHYLLFGYGFPDRKYHKTSESGERLYTSKLLNEAWPFGHAWIGDVTYETCAYVAGYVLKKITGEKAWEHYRTTDENGVDWWLEPEFNLMSRGGRRGRGIAAEWWEKFNPDVYTSDTVVRNATETKPPRYYDKLLALFDPVQWEVIKMRREARAQDLAGDNTPARLAEKEAVTKAKMALKKRNLEK